MYGIFLFWYLCSHILNSFIVGIKIQLPMCMKEIQIIGWLVCILLDFFNKVLSLYQTYIHFLETLISCFQTIVPKEKCFRHWKRTQVEISFSNHPRISCDTSQDPGSHCQTSIYNRVWGFFSFVFFNIKHCFS